MNILLVEDENRIADFVVRGLKSMGWTVQHAPDGASAEKALREGGFDIVILDLMLPDTSGQDICRKMRARKNMTPVLMLSALDAIDERIDGLKIGADDYMTKPFDFDELTTRIEALHRRASIATADSNETHVIRNGTICIDLQSLNVDVAGDKVEMTAKERDVLTYFLRNPDRVIPRERILNAVWGANEDPLTNVIDVYIARLRRKLGEEGSRIVTLRGSGYRFDSLPEDS